MNIKEKVTGLDLIVHPRYVDDPTNLCRRCWVAELLIRKSLDDSKMPGNKIGRFGTSYPLEELKNPTRAGLYLAGNLPKTVSVYIYGEKIVGGICFMPSRDFDFRSIPGTVEPIPCLTCRGRQIPSKE